MPTLKNRLEALEDYLDDQTWWQNTYWPVWRVWNKYKPSNLYMEAKYFIQRGRRGYSERDLWSADTHIARVTLAFLNDVGKWGVPVSSIKGEDSFEASQARWNKTEDELRWLMEQHLNDDVTKWEERSEPEYRKRVERANRLFGKYWMSLWD